MSIGFLLLLSFILRFEPFVSKTRTTLELPFTTERWRGVRPSESWISRGTPQEHKKFTQFSHPRKLAQCKGVPFLKSRESRLMPFN